MTIQRRAYQRHADYQRVSEFLIRHHQPGNADGNWIEPIWEYMHFHPAFDESMSERIAVWEDDGELVAVAHYESRLGEAFFQFHPACQHLFPAMLEHAEANFTAISQKDGRRYLCAYINDNQAAFQTEMRQRGYTIRENWERPLYRFDIPQDFPPVTVADGFRITSLAEECDWAKVHRVMWRGFNHEGEPPAGEDELESRRIMFDTPKAQRSLKIAVANPDGDFVAFCGMFIEPNGQFALVEPVATDPDYRRLGLGKAAVLEGIRRCGEQGAHIAYVGSDQAFYQAIGFYKVYNSECWIRYW